MTIDQRITLAILSGFLIGSGLTSLVFIVALYFNRG